MDGYTS